MWEVYHPSKKCKNGIPVLTVAIWDTIAMSCTSYTLEEHKRAKPVYLQAITSEWSLKILKACLEIVLLATCITVGALSPAIKYMLGIISKRP